MGLSPRSSSPSTLSSPMTTFLPLSLLWNWPAQNLETSPNATPWTCQQILFQCLYSLSQLKISVEGKIYHKFDMKPHGKTIEDYGKLCRERTNKYKTKTRQIQVIDDDSGQHLRPMPGMIGLKPAVPQEKRKMPAKGSEVKRTRRGRDEMEEIMFKLFERQPNWSLKQLIQETDQPEQFMKDMLKLLCVYNNKGSNQGTYELKPEYKKSEDDPDSK